MKRPVAIWGSTEWQPLFFKLVSETVFEPVAAVNCQLCREFDIPRFSEDQYFDKMTAGTPVVLFSENKDTFLKHAARIRRKAGSEPVKILHPAFLNPHLRAASECRALVAGANRSGSNLLATIISTVIENVPARETDASRFSSRSAKNHFEFITGFLSDAFRAAGAGYTGSGAVTFGGIDFFGAGSGSCFFLSPVQAQRFFFDQVHRTYTPVGEELLAHAGKNSLSVFVPVRNPLDIIVSNAFEYEYVFFNMVPGEDLDIVDSVFRENYGCAHLANLAWFRQMALYVKKHLEAYLNFQDECHGYRYEDILDEPLKKMREISQIVGVPTMTEDQLCDIWEKRIFKKPLARYKAHMFRPGTGKHKKYLCSEHIDILRELEFDHLLSDLDYPLLQDPGRSLNRGRPDVGHHMQMAQTARDIGLHVQMKTGFSLSGSRKLCSCSSDSDKIPGLRFAANHEPFADVFRELMSSSEFETLALSLEIEPERQVNV